MGRETMIDAARRRIRDGDLRIARQARLLRSLEEQGWEEGHALATGLLTRLRESQKEMQRSFLLMIGREEPAPPPDPAAAPLSPDGMADLAGLLFHALLHRQDGAAAVFTEVLRTLNPGEGAGTQPPEEPREQP